MDLQMKEQDEIANKKMTVQDFPTTAASYAPVGFAEEGGGVGSQQEMFPALKAMQKGLPPEMSKNSKRQVGKAAEEEVQVLEQMLGYRDDSPFRNKSSINIYSDTIDMGQKGDGTGTPLLAVADNGDSKILKPYSGMHTFPGASMVTEVPIPKAQQGVMASRKNINQFPFLDRAGVTPAESSARSFIIDEIKSDGYREKIINLLPKNLSKTEKEKRAASLISSRLNALNSAVNAGINNDLGKASINAEYFGPSRLQPNLRFADNSMLNNTSINVHELDHAAKRGHKLIMPEEEDVVFQNIKNSRDVPKEDRGYHMYVASTPEIGANLMQFRKFVVDNKFAKHGEKITEDKFLEIWDALDESKDKYSQDAFYDVINTLKDTKSEDAISRFTKLYNTITNVGGKNNTSVFNAKNGGKPKNNNNEITKLLGMNKYENGGKVMQNYMPVGNGKTKVHGFINLASMIPIQTEKKELIVLPDGNLVPVNAKKRHSQMSDDEVTDIVPENSYILSQFGSVDIYKSEADQIQMEVENKPYNMYGSNPTPKVKTLGDIMRKKVMKPADMARLVEQKYKIMDHDDPFTIQTNAINKHRRGDYLQAIIQLSEYDKARKGIDNSIETQLSQNNQQPPQMVASNGGKVLRAGYNVPKAFNPLDLIGSSVQYCRC